MRVFRTVLSVLAASLVGTAAYAVQPQSWVSGSGTGTPCTFDAPCGTFFNAYNATTNGGVISVLNSGDFFQGGQFVISKSITIRAIGTDAGTARTTLYGSTLQVNGFPDTVVVLDGLRIAGLGLIIGGSGTVLIRNCKFSFNSANTTSASQVYGVRIQPTGALKVVISDTVVENDGIAAGGGGFVIAPQSGGSAAIMFERVTAQRNTFGLAIDGSQSTAGINVTIADSVLSANANDGLLATTAAGGAPIGVLVSNSNTTNNGYGIRAIGPNVTVRIDNSRIAGNGTGVSALGGGELLSAGNNVVQANGTNGAFTGAVPLQ